MEPVDYLQKPVQIAQEGLLELARLSSKSSKLGFYSYYNNLLFPFFNSLLNFIYRQFQLNLIARRMALARINIILPYRNWLNKIQQSKELGFPSNTAYDFFLTLNNSLFTQAVYSELEAEFEKTFPRKEEQLTNYKFPPRKSLFYKRLDVKKSLPQGKPILPESKEGTLPVTPYTLFAPEAFSAITSTIMEQSYLVPRLSTIVIPEITLREEKSREHKSAIAPSIEENRLLERTTSKFVSEEELANRTSKKREIVDEQKLTLPKRGLPVEKAIEPFQQPTVNDFAKWQTALSVKALPFVSMWASLLSPSKIVSPTISTESKKLTTPTLKFEKYRMNHENKEISIEYQTAGSSKLSSRLEEEDKPLKKLEEIPQKPFIASKLSFQSLSAFYYAKVLPSLLIGQQTLFQQITKAIAISALLSPPILKPSLGSSQVYFGRSVKLPSTSGLTEMTELQKEETFQSSIISSSSLPSINKPSNLPAQFLFETPGKTITSIESPEMYTLSKEVFPSLTSAIYEGSEALRTTNVALSAVPIAASIAENVITETFFQPTSNHNVVKPLNTEDGATKEEKTARLPTMLALAGAGNIITQRLQGELTKLSGKFALPISPIVNPVLEAMKAGVTSTNGLGRPIVLPIAAIIANQLISAVSEVPEEKRGSEKVAAGSIAAVSEIAAGFVLGASYRASAARASKATLIAGNIVALGEANSTLLGAPHMRATSDASNTFIKATSRASQTATAIMVASSYAVLSKLYAGASAEEKAGASALDAARSLTKAALTQSLPATTNVPTLSPISKLQSKPLSVMPATKSYVEFEGEEMIEDEEDLRGLERKIRKILSEELSRCYGSSSILGGR
jgi:hypothetical protein